MSRTKLERSKKLHLLLEDMYTVKYYCVEMGVFQRGDKIFWLINNFKFPPSCVVRRNTKTYWILIELHKGR
jgi:hypothetical protein